MAVCPAFPSDGAFVRGMIGYIDCQAQSIGESGYAALATLGSSASLVLTGALTIFIALFGYRLILGEQVSVRDGLLGITKIGVVLMLATSWGAFRPLVYDVTMHGPASLTADIGGAGALPGAGGGLVDWLQSVDDNLVELGIVGAGQFPNQTTSNAPQEGVGAGSRAGSLGQTSPLQLQQSPRWDPLRDRALIENARTLYLTSALGALGAVRLIAGLLLALGPFFVIGLFFDATRGLFIGWVRGLLGVMLGATSTAIILGVELALIGPWLVGVLAARNAEISTPSAPVEIFVMTLVFALTLVAGLIASAFVARGFSLSPVIRLVLPDGRVQPVRDANALSLLSDSIAPNPATERTRALAVADAVRAGQQRDERALLVQTAVNDPRRGPANSLGRDAEMRIVSPLGRSFRRRTATRVSSGAARRDRRL